ncbi:MAG: hypothetical protein NC394_02940 [Bacteroides sp.]|nr:hypothetical protein [Bacteroides sp.]
MKKGKFKKSAVGILTAAAVLMTGTSASLYADSEYRYNDNEKISAVSDGEAYETVFTEYSEPESPEPITENTEEESPESGSETEIGSVTEAPESTPSETEPAISEEITSEATSKPHFVVPTEAPSTASPIIIILIGPQFGPVESDEPVPFEPISFETTMPEPAPPQTTLPPKEPTVAQEVVTEGDVPKVKMDISGAELLTAIVDPFERAGLTDGPEVGAVLSVRDGSGLSDADKELILAAAQASPNVRYSVGQYLDISLTRTLYGEELSISETYKKITLTIEIPQSIKDPSYTYGLIRVHDGTAVLLDDLDGDPDTITVKTDLFSAYAIVYTKDIVNQDVNIKTANRLDRLNIFLFLTAAAVILCSFAAIYVLWSGKSRKHGKK